MFASVTGIVMSSDGRAISGARVSLYAIETFEARRARQLSASPEAVPLASTQTDSKGAFTLESPKAPIVELHLSSRGYEPWQGTIERDEEAGAIVLLKADMKSGSVTANGKPVANATVVINYSAPEYLVKTDAQGRYEAPDPKRASSLFVIHPDFGVSEEVAQGFNSGIRSLNRTLTAGPPLSGRVTGEDGKTPIAKATILADGWPLATSGDDGAFTIAHMPAKWTTLTAQAGSLIGRRAKTSEPAVTIRVAKAATVSGRVTDTKTKLPVPGAIVRINVRGQRMVTSGWVTLTDAKGNYTLNVAPGSYGLSGWHPAYETRGTDISLTSGQSSSKELTLSPLARVSGMVMNDERKPVVAAQVASVNASEGLDSPMRMMMLSTGGSVVSGPDGRFSMRVRSDADLKLRATKKGLPSAQSDSFKLAPAERKSNVVISIPSGIEVTGKVTDREGNPLSGVGIMPQLAAPGQRGMMQRIMLGAPPPNDEETNVRTGSDGTFSLRVAEGTYDFAFRREGFSTKNVRGKSVSAGGANVVEATLDPSVEISGRVTRSGAGVDGVSLFSFGDGDPIDTVTGPDGSFTLSGLSPGTARVMLRKEEELISEQRTVTAPGRDVVIELPVGVRVSGRVIEKSTRKPVTTFQAGVSISRSGGGMVMMAPPLLKSFTSDDGTFTLDNVPLGAVNFVAQAPGYSGARLNLNVEEGKPITGLEVELDTGVRLAGKITGPDGAALADATVRIAMMGGPGSVMRGTDKRTTTTSSGEYELEALEPGEETIEVVHGKYLTERRTVQLKGREVRLDVQLSAGNRATGFVVTESGAPVGEADVEAMAAGGTMKRGKTDASGRFELDSLSPARYQFSASKAGYAEGTVKDVDIAAGTPVRIVLKSGGIVSGFVRGLTEPELAQTFVEARGSEGMSSAAVEPSGAFRLEGVPIGTVTIRAMTTGRGFSSRKSSTPQTVEIAAGSSRQVDIEFRSDTVVKGRVRRNGQALAGASVTFMPRPGGPQTNAGTSADDQGNYSVTGLDDGEYSVIVSDMQRFTSYTTTYAVHGSATFDIDHTANTLRGRVVDSASGDPIDGARVQLRSTGTGAATMRFGDRVAATDSTGGFTLDLVPPGNYVMTADRDGYGNDVRNITVTESSMENVELKLQPTDGISLKVVDERDGRALSARMVVFDMQGRVVREQFNFFPGTETTENRLPLAAGMYEATVTAMGYGTRHVSLRSPSSQRVPLTPAARLLVRSKHSERQRVRLLDASGKPYPRWTEQLPQMFLNPSPGTTTIDYLAAGAYTLLLLGDNDTVLDSKQVLVGAGQTLELEI